MSPKAKPGHEPRLAGRCLRRCTEVGTEIHGAEVSVEIHGTDLGAEIHGAKVLPRQIHVDVDSYMYTPN
jgi:hypothetical protein